MQDRDRCSEIKDVNIPYSNRNQSIMDSSFVSFSTHVPTKTDKINSRCPNLEETPKFGRDRDRDITKYGST